MSATAKSKSARVPESEWAWYGYAGHFAGGKRCAYHLCTRIGGVLISTIGDFLPRAGGKPEPLGAGSDSLYETFVFRCGGEAESGDPVILGYDAIDSQRYPASIEAERGHREFCQRYALKEHQP